MQKPQLIMLTAIHLTKEGELDQMSVTLINCQMIWYSSQKHTSVGSLPLYSIIKTRKHC